MVYVYNGILGSYKKDEIPQSAATWIKLEGIMLNKTSQYKKVNSWVIYLFVLWKDETKE